MKQELIEYGLSDKEAEIYLITIKTGEATANRIAELADLARSTTYDILERLKNLGLISSYIEGNKTHFVAKSPDALLISLDEKKQKINKILPDLKEIRKKIGEKPTTEVFQCKIAILNLLNEILENAKSLKVIGSRENALGRIDYHPEKFAIRRVEKKIPLKQILEISETAEKAKKKKYTETRFLKELEKSKEVTFIFDDYVYHILLQHEITAIKIKSKEHSRATEIMFDKLWKIAK